MKPFVNYALEGYDPDDGLDETCGRWMRDDTWGVVRWVETADASPRCECGRPIGPRARACDTCATRKRRQERRSLIACPTCQATIDQSCRDVDGVWTSNHPARVVRRRCHCGSDAGEGSTYCGPCSDNAKRESWRASKRRARARREEAAA